MNILNLYSGIGGNRKLWSSEHKITAVEKNAEIAAVYKKLFPADLVLIRDAHKFLLQNFKKYDFIWSSPPCQSHSLCNYFLKGQGILRYPDMRLYEEIIFLQKQALCKWVVENVVSYYNPLIKPQKVGRHFFWSNFFISDLKLKHQIGTMNRKTSKETQRKTIIREAQIPELLELHGLKDFNISNKRQILRNCVLPVLGKHVLDCALKEEQTTMKALTRKP